MAVLVSNKPFVGDLWALAKEGAGFTFRWNVDCDIPDTVGSTSFYLCGDGDAAFAPDGTISGFLPANAYSDMDHRPFCTSGFHQFLFQHRN
jgi:hypothetical protein